MRKELLAVLAVMAVTAWQTSSTAEASDAGQIKRGKQLVDRQGCQHCHFIEGEGGFIGPPLDGIGKRRSRDFLVGVLARGMPTSKRRSAGYPDPRELMRHVRLTARDASSIADYLMSLPAEEDLSVKGHEEESDDDRLPKGSGFKPARHTASSRKGMELYRQSGCAACHSIGGVGGRLAPKLDGIAAYRSKDFIKNRIARGAIVIYGGKEYRPSGFSMPASHLSGKQIEEITDFLMTLPE